MQPNVYQHGRRKGGGLVLPMDFEISTEKGCFLSFEWEKTNFATFPPPLEKFWKIPLVAPLEKILQRPMCIRYVHQKHNTCEAW